MFKAKIVYFLKTYCDFEPLLKIAVSNIPMGKNCGSPQKLRKIAEIAKKLRTAIPPPEKRAKIRICPFAQERGNLQGLANCSTLGLKGNIPVI